MSRMLVLGQTCLLLVGAATPVSLGAQSGASDGQWRSYGGDQGHSKYSPLDQITKDNVHDLRIAWTWTSVDEQLKEQNEVIR